jgi:hypothetical protein
MRSTPYKFLKATPATEPKAGTAIAEQSFEDSIVRDLSAELKRPAATPPPPPPATDTPADSPEEVPATDTPTGTATLTEKVEKVKASIEQELNATLENPKRSAKNALRFINFGRLMLYPFLYKKVLFEGPELTAIDALLLKIAEAEKQNKKPELNAYETRLWDKWQKYEVHKSKVLWTEEEINDITEVAYLKLAEIKFLRWLMENEWAIVILVIEGKRWAPVAGQRFGFDLNF